MPKTFLPELLNFTRAKRSVIPMNPDEFRKIRKAAGLTQGKMAKCLDVTRLTVNNWENAKFRIPDDILDRLAEKGLGVPTTVPKASSKLVKSTVEAYRKMRGQPGETGTHANIVKFWHDNGFTPSPEAQEQILAEWPDILANSNNQPQNKGD